LRRLVAARHSKVSLRTRSPIALRWGFCVALAGVLRYDFPVHEGHHRMDRMTLSPIVSDGAFAFASRTEGSNMVFHPFFRMCITHLPTGIKAETESFERGMSALRTRQSLMPLLLSRISRHGEYGPPCLVRSYDLTGDGADDTKEILDGGIPLPPKEARER
jgi:hypothetical protein